MNRLNYSRGFTLVELMVSLIIVSISIIALYYMFLQGHTLMIEQNHRRTAFEKAKQKLIEQEVRYYSNNYETGVETGEDFLAEPDEEIEFQGVSASYSVTKILDPDNDVPFVTVTYTWTESSGRDYEVTLVKSFIKRAS